MPFLIYRDKMRAEGPNHYPYILGMALNQYTINTEVSICFILQPALKINKKVIRIISIKNCICCPANIPSYRTAL